MAGSLTPYSSTYMKDRATRAMATVDYPHHEIHDGSSFTAYYSRTTAATNAHRSGLYIKTPNTTKWGHLVVSVSASAAATVSICEAPTIAANVGTHTSPILNRNRNSTATSVMSNNATSPAAGYFTTLDETAIAADGTWATGTVLRTVPITTGVGANVVGGLSRDTQEWVLDQNTAYVVLITNTAASANNHIIMLDWYEHTDVA